MTALFVPETDPASAVANVPPVHPTNDPGTTVPTTLEVPAVVPPTVPSAFEVICAENVPDCVTANMHPTPELRVPICVTGIGEPVKVPDDPDVTITVATAVALPPEPVAVSV